MINPYEAIQVAKDNYPDLYAKQSDEDIFNSLKRQYPDLNWGKPDWEDDERTGSTGNINEVDDSPGLISSLLLGNANELFTDKYDWAKRNYNNSLAGNVYKMMYGKNKYKVEDIPNEWYQDAAGFFMSIVNPLEMGLFAFSGGTAKLAATPVSRLIAKEGFKKGVFEGTKKTASRKISDKAFGNYMMKEATVHNALQMGTFSSAHGAIARYGQQSLEIENGQRNKYDHGSVLLGAAGDFTTGATLGAMGGAVKSAMANKFARSTRSIDKLKKTGDVVPLQLASQRMLTHPLGQVMAEANVFTAGHLGLEAISSGHMPTFEDYFKGLAMNTAIVGGMRTGTKWGRRGSNDVSRYYKTKMALQKEVRAERNIKSLREVAKNIEEQGGNPNKELLEEAARLELKLIDSKSEKSDVKKAFKRYEELESKENLSSKEQAELVETGVLLNSWLIDFYQGLKTGEGFESAKEMYAKELGVEVLNKKQEATVSKIIKNKQNELIELSESLNETLKGVKDIKIEKKAKEKVSQEEVKWETLSDDALVRKVADITQRSYDEIRNEFTFERSTAIGKEKVLNRNQLIDFGKEKLIEVPVEVRFAYDKIPTPDEAVQRFSKKSGQLEDKAIEIANKLDKEGIEFDYKGTSKLNESYYDINDIALNHLIQRRATTGGRAGTGALVETSTDLKYIDTYNKFAKSLSKDGKSLRGATYDDVLSFITNNIGSQNALAILYRRLNNAGLLKDKQLQLNIDEISRVKGKIPEKPQKGLRAEDFNADEGRIKYVQSKTFGEKGAPISDKLTSLLKSIFPGKDVINTMFRDVNNDAITGVTVKNVIKKYFGGDKNQKDFRNALSQYVATKYGLGSKQWAVIDAVGLAHKQAKGTKEQRAYVKDVKLDDAFIKLREEFVSLIEGKGELDAAFKGKYKEGGLTVEELRTGLSKILADTDKGDIKIGHKTLNPETREAIIRFMIEASPRPGEVVPQKQKDVAYIKPERIVKERKIATRPEGEIIFKGKGADKARKDFIKKVAKKNNVTEKELREANLDEGVLGTFVEGDIKLAKGVFQPADYYHENLHRLKRFAKVTGNKKLSKLIERGEKLGKGTKEYKEWIKKNKGRDMEEFLGDISGGKASRMEFSKGVLPKLNQFIKQLTSQVKVALGMGNFNDIARVLAGKVRKGFDTKGVDLKGGKIKYKKQADDLSAAKKISGDLMGSLRAVMKKLNLEKESEVINYIKEMAGIEGEFKIQKIKGAPEGVEPSIHLDNLQKFKSTLDSIGAEKIRRDVDVRRKFKTVALIEKTRRAPDIDITRKEQKAILESLGVEKGSEWRASQSQLNDYLEILHSSRTARYSDNNRVDNQIAINIIKDKKLKAFAQGEVEASKFFMPVRHVLKKLGLNKLHDSLTDHVATEAGHLGIYDKFVTDIKVGYVAKDGTKIEGLGKIPVTRDRAFDRIKDSIFSIDARGQRLLESMDFAKKYEGSSKLSKAEKINIKNAESFFNKAIKKEWFATVKDGKGDNLRAKENGKYKYLNLDSKEGRIVEKYIEFTDYYKSQIKEVFRKVMSKTEYEDFIEGGGLKWIEDGIFVTRQTTKEAKKILNLGSKEVQRLIEDSTFNYAKERAKEHFKTDSPSAEQINKFYDESAKMAAYADFQNASSFSLNKITSKHLLKRYAKLPEFIEDPNTGKLVRTYETSFAGTVTRYAVGMSKFLSSVEFFPEFAKIKGFKGVDVKGQLGKVREQSPELAKYVEEIINTRLGLGEANPFTVSSGVVQLYANILAKVGLSAPTSGLKNIITGTAGIMYAQKLGFMGKGLADVIRGEGMAMTKTGGQVIGMSHYDEPGKVTGFLDKTLFRFGGMRITEKFNRNFAQLVAKHDQRALFQVLSDRNIKKGSKKYDKAYDRLKDFYELSNKQIELVKKYGFENVNLKKEAFPSTRDYVIEKRNLENAYQKMNTMAHIKTQGAALDIFSPKWASGKYIKPMLLYKRMAYAATINTKENIQLAFKSGDYGKIIAGTMGTYFGGAALMGIYWNMLGTPMPKENSPEWKNIMTTMWKGEFLGILSEFFSPYDSTLGGSIAPAIYQNLGAFVGSASSVWKGEKYFGQGLDDYMRRTVSAYNAYKKVIERRNNPYNRDMLRVKNLYKQFEDEVMKTPNAVYESTTNTKYFRDLQNAFNLGNEKEFAVAFATTYYALASDYYNKGYAEHPDGIRRVKSLQDAFKKASSTLKRKMKALNPNPATFGKKRYEGKARAAKFRNWVAKRTLKDKQGTLKGKELEKRMDGLETEYRVKMKKNMKALPYYFRKLNLKSLINENEWIHKL